MGNLPHIRLEEEVNWLLDQMIKLPFGICVAILGIGIFAILSIVAAIPTYFLWNWLMPDILAVKSITFWQAWGINFLAAILFKNTSSRR